MAPRFLVVSFCGRPLHCKDFLWRSGNMVGCSLLSGLSVAGNRPAGLDAVRGSSPNLISALRAHRTLRVCPIPVFDGLPSRHCHPRNSSEPLLLNPWRLRLFTRPAALQVRDKCHREQGRPMQCALSCSPVQRRRDALDGAQEAD